MKRILAASVILAAVGSLYGQSVADLSRQEKARRESLKDRRAKVVTNVDLAALRKLPALITPSEQTAAENPEMSGGPVSNSPASARNDMVPSVAPNGPALSYPGSSSSVGGAGNLEAQLKAANEQVDLLTDKMNQLLQESNNLNTMTPRDVIMQQIDDTSQKLAQAQDDAAKLKAQLEAAQKNPPAKR
ncbi:MAG: hypothetical protein ABR951_04030 [Candidatus Aminicenantales bacterium]|jgi:hypothetical protein